MNGLPGNRFIPFRFLIVIACFFPMRATSTNLSNNRRIGTSFRSNVNLKNVGIFDANQIESGKSIALTGGNSKSALLKFGFIQKPDGHLKVKLPPKAANRRGLASARRGRNYDLIDNQLHKLVSSRRKLCGAEKCGKSSHIDVTRVQKQRPVTGQRIRHDIHGGINSDDKIVSVKETGDLHLHAIGLIALRVYDVAGKGITYRANQAARALSVNKSAKSSGIIDGKRGRLYNGLRGNCNKKIIDIVNVVNSGNKINPEHQSLEVKNGHGLCHGLEPCGSINKTRDEGESGTRDSKKDIYVIRAHAYIHSGSVNNSQGKHLSVSRKAITTTTQNNVPENKLRHDLSAKLKEKDNQKVKHTVSTPSARIIVSKYDTKQLLLTILLSAETDITKTEECILTSTNVNTIQEQALKANKITKTQEKLLTANGVTKAQEKQSTANGVIKTQGKFNSPLGDNRKLVRRKRKSASPGGNGDYSHGSLSGYDLYVKISELLSAMMNSTDLDTDGAVKRVPSLVEEMCKEIFEDEPMNDDGQVYCNISWDEYSCWPRTIAGYVAVIPCPGYLPGIDHTNNATKLCHENGTWADKAIYDMCLEADDPLIEDSHKKIIRAIYVVGFILSTLTLAVALFIFLYFRSLRCLRNSIHCHLIVAFILKNIIWIVMRDSLIAIQNSQYLWLCKLLVLMFNYLTATNFFWMYVEGLYLHIIIVWTYSADKIKLRYLLIIGWGLPLIFIIIWMIVKLEYENDNCWLPDTQMSNSTLYDYVFIGPILFVLLANIIFLSTIIWVLITKLRASHSLETRQYRKAVRATIILFPLLGITYVLFIAPPSDHPGVQTVFDYINAVLQSFQGVSVAIFYCFLNGEVKGTLKKKISRYNDARSLSTRYTKASMGWTPGGASRDFGNSVVPRNNDSVWDDNTRVNGAVIQTENIPLTNQSDVETNLDS